MYDAYKVFTTYCIRNMYCISNNCMVGHCAVDFPEVYYLDLFNDCGIISLDTLLVYISNSSYMLLSPQQGKK